MPPLNEFLAHLLNDHGVAAEVHDGAVWIPSVGRWATLTAEPTGPQVRLMTLRATVDDSTVLVDRWAALGATEPQALQDGLQAFCRGAFHVFLAALWGVLETDQVDHEVHSIAGKPWDFYLGPCLSRVSAGVEPLVLPDAMTDSALAAMEASSSTIRLARIYVAALDGKPTYEALLNDAEHEPLRQVVVEANWRFPSKGFVSLRWIVIAREQTNGSAHRVTRTCS